MWNNSEEYNETWFGVNLNETEPVTNHTQPINFQINTPHNIFIISVYVIVFIIAAIGNLTVLASLFRSRHRKSRISLMICHLTIADLIVTFVMIPIEVGWRITGCWVAGNVACKIFQFLRALGPYLSSNVLICISLDRYFAVVYPFRINAARQRGKFMIAVAWGAALLYCIPQCFVFSLKAHPLKPDFKQCVTFGSFSSKLMELVYNVLCIMFLYFIPLAVIIVTYSYIMAEISKTSKISNDKTARKGDGQLRLRRSDTRNIERARSKTLRLTITIVAVYICCCTPYTIMTLWYMFDRSSAEKVLPAFLQDLFFMMVVSNSCMNPIVYGSFVTDFKHFSCHCCSKCNKRNPAESIIPLHVNLTRTSPTPLQAKQAKANKNFDSLITIREFPRRSVAHRFRHDKFYSEVLVSSTSGRNDLKFHSEPAVRCTPGPEAFNERNENILVTRRNLNLEFVQIKPNEFCVSYVKNETTFIYANK